MKERISMESIVKRWSESSLWGNWNRQRINSIMRQKALCEVRIGILKKNENLYDDNFTWVGISGNPSFDYFDYKGVYKTDYHNIFGSYSKIGLYMKDFKFDLEFASNGDDFVYKVIPRTLSENYEVFIGFLIGAQKENFNGGKVTLTDSGCVFYSKEGEFVIEIEGERSNIAIDTLYPGLFYKSSSNIYIKCNNSRSKAEADDFINIARENYISKRVYGEGFLGEGVVESLIKAMGWNKTYDNVHDTFKSDVTRLWAPKSCYYTFYWDNFLTSLLYGLENEKMAYDQVDSVCSEFKDGFLPQCAFEWGSSNMINPPIGSYCLLKLYNQFGNKAILESYFDKLYATNTYLIENKSWKKDGIIQLAQCGKEIENSSDLALATGLDNSPMYDNAKEVNLNDIGMSSIFALDCNMLSKIAEILERDQEKEILIKRYNKVKNAINELMWDDSKGIYCNTTLEGTYCDVYSPTSFYPMIANIATYERAQRLVKEHILNEEEFWGEYIIPSISKKHPAYHEQEYWRGCAWPPMNLIVYEGLKNYGDYNTAYIFARKSLNMYMQNWKDYGLVLENYNTKTGGISKNCVPMYTWGGLMAYMAVEEVFEVSPLGGLKFGNLSGEYAAIKNLRVGQDLFDIFTGSNIKVYKNNELLLETNSPAIIKDFIIEKDTCSFEVISEKPCNCIIYSNASNIHAKINNEIRVLKASEGRGTFKID
jgi:putative isomerase